MTIRISRSSRPDRRVLRRSTVAIASLLFAVLPTTAFADDPVAAPTTAEAPAPGTEAGEPTAQATDEPEGSGILEWGIEPSPQFGAAGRNDFRPSVSPGDQLVDGIRLYNFSDVPMDFEVYAADALATADDSFAVARKDDLHTGIGRWIGFEEASRTVTLTIEAGATYDVPFQINVPENATPGDHVGGIVASYLSPTATDEDGNSVTTDYRITARMYVRVDGPLDPQLSISEPAVSFSDGGFGGGTFTADWTATNTGNMQIGGTITATVSSLFGLITVHKDLGDLPPLLPGQSADFSSLLEDVHGLGPATVEISVLPEPVNPAGAPEATVVTASASLWALGLLFWVGLGALVLILALITWRIIVRVRRRRKAAATPEQTTAQVTEQPSDAPTVDSAASGEKS